ncbi:MAG: outer-membrane lipoprotein carrier protein LolA [Chitinispirillales bacterium]|jgi:outer membrane lipoprotein-sorting protein|nr:outer-membrane lipoprotein carrier protein LolA [Chitinispirillales bacterium]
MRLTSTTANIIIGAFMLLIVFQAIVSVSAQAQEPAIISEVRRNYGGSRAVSATFDLTIYWSVREREEKKNGELITAPGDRFRVTLGRDVFVSDGKTYWQYNERNSQVVVRNFSDIDPSTLPSALLSSFLSNRRFNEGVPIRNGTVEFNWTGDGAAAGDGYKRVSVVVATGRVHPQSGVIQTLTLVDANDNVHTYTFTRTEFDKPVRNDTFQFRAPRGVEVMDMRDGR